MRAYEKWFAIGLLAVLTPSLEAIVISSGSPGDAAYANTFTGVGAFVTNLSVSCTGSLIGTGMHVLTAAHCISGATGGTVTFGSFDYNVVSLAANPSFSGNTLQGFDVAILTLDQIVDASIARYGLYTGTDELGQTGTVVGFGGSGTGLTGATISSGTGRQGVNVIDVILNGQVLLYDFDQPGVPSSNSLGGFALLNEVNAATGDSGGPTFLGGLIAGVHSFGTCLSYDGQTCSVPPDVDGALNSTFGERFGDTRVSQNVDWIKSMTSVPEPGTYGLGLLGIGAMGLFRRYRRP